jgi:hypothetical protein
VGTLKEEIIDNMLVKVLMERKRLNQALEQNKFLEEDLRKLKTLEEERIK